MDTGIRASAAVGLGAFALSVIVAIFSRVPFGILLLRALLLGLAFAALTFGFGFLLRRFLPELFGASATGMDRGQDGLTGSMVDIMVQDDDGVAAGFAPREPEAERPLGPAEAYAAARPAELAGEEEEMEELEREVEDIRSEGLLPRDGPGMDNRDKPARPSVALDELDVLPDLDSMSDSFASEVVSGLGSESDDPAGRALPPEGSGGGADPAALAKAVQTLLRRDQKG